MKKNKIMNRNVSKQLWSSYLNLINSLEEINDLNKLYKKIINWIIEEEYYFKDHILKDSILDILISLNPYEYFLNEEKIKIIIDLKKLYKPEEKNYKVSTLIKFIGEILWDFITTSNTEKQCKYCDTQYDMQYVLVNNELILECGFCGRMYKLDGKEFDEKIISYMPAKKKDLKNVIYF